jgi:hypothetical protein
VHELATACPAILSEKPLELQRKVDFLCATLNMELEDCLAHPTYLGASLMQVGMCCQFATVSCCGGNGGDTQHAAGGLPSSPNIPGRITHAGEHVLSVLYCFLLWW